MAWKEYSQFSKADQQHEDARQKMIVSQSCLDRAVSIFVASNPNVEFPLDPSTEEQLKKLAGVFVDWVYEKAYESVVGSTPSTPLGSAPGPRAPQLPEPTLAQKKVLDAIAGKQNKTQVDPQLKTDVLDWAEETHGQRSYPTKLESVETFLKWFNK